MVIIFEAVSSVNFCKLRGSFSPSIDVFLSFPNIWGSKILPMGIHLMVTIEGSNMANKNPNPVHFWYTKAKNFQGSLKAPLE